MASPKRKKGLDRQEGSKRTKGLNRPERGNSYKKRPYPREIESDRMVQLQVAGFPCTGDRWRGKEKKREKPQQKNEQARQKDRSLVRRSSLTEHVIG